MDRSSDFGTLDPCVFPLGGRDSEVCFRAIHAFLLASVIDSDAFLEQVSGKLKEYVEKWVWMWVSNRPATSG